MAKDANHSDLFDQLARLRCRLTDTSDLNRPNRPAKMLDAIGTFPGISIVGLFDPYEVWRDLCTNPRIAPDLRYWWPDCTTLIDFKNPATQYGRAGLNDNQKEIAAKHPVLVIATPDDVERYGVK